MYKSLLTLMSSSIITKIIGIVRQILYSFTLGVSTGYSNLLSLLSYVDAFQILSNTGNLNTYYFPKWEKNISENNERLKIEFGIYSFISTILICVLVIYYNYQFVYKGNYLEIVSTSIIWLFILLSNILLSLILFLEKYKTFRLIAVLNSIISLVGAFSTFLIDYYGVLLSRYLALSFTIIYGYLILKNKIKLEFNLSPIYKTHSNQIFDNFFRIIVGSYAILPIMILKILFSLNNTEEMALLFYALLIPTSIYLFTTKNIAPIWMKVEIRTNNSKKLNWYLIIFLSFISHLTLIILVPYLNNLIFYISDLDKSNLARINEISQVLMFTFAITSVIELILLQTVKNEMNLSKRLYLTFSFIFALVVGLTIFKILN